MQQNPAILPLRQEFERDGYCFSEGPNYRAAVIFCITARVGSTALMSSFAKVIGATALPEIFNPRHPFLVLQQKYQAKSLQEYVNKHFAENMTGEDVVFKTNFFDMFYFLREHGLPVLFPRVKFIYIHRSDMVAQAYSLWKANKYQVWHSTTGESGAREGGAPEPEIVVDPDDRVRILKNMTNLYRECGQWEHFFRRTRAEVTSVSYEEIDRDLPGVLRRVHQFAFGIALPAIEATTDNVRTSNAGDAENIKAVKDYIAGL
ncbi:MAG TPA: Stf0 family sulfotransferase [Thermohalobaculum sp.]|nr:Stf0 family sulfotransferase [Thermohalobaculum sp.]